MNVLKPSFEIEKSYWLRGIECVIGVDEVGRGALAGPVVAAAAAVKRIKNPALGGARHGRHELRIKNIGSLGIDDSKRLSHRQRETLVPFIRRYFHVAVGEASVEEINCLGIIKATHKAMRRAINCLWSLVIGHWSIEHRTAILLVDGYTIPRVRGFSKPRQLGIIRGDQQSISIAAASIVAKVYRDRMMRTLSHSYPNYRWEENKGYGTDYHRSSITQYGVTYLHRSAFVDTLLSSI